VKTICLTILSSLIVDKSKGAVEFLILTIIKAGCSPAKAMKTIDVNGTATCCLHVAATVKDPLN